MSKIQSVIDNRRINKFQRLDLSTNSRQSQTNSLIIDNLPLISISELQHDLKMTTSLTPGKKWY